MGSSLFLSVILLTSPLVVPSNEQVASPNRFGVDDIRPTVHELLAGHLEKKKVTPQILQQTCLNCIDKMDPDKIYFLQSEVDAFTKRQFGEKAYQQYSQGQFTFFLELMNCMQTAIDRARALRHQKLAKAPFSSEESFARNMAELQARQRAAFSNPSILAENEKREVQFSLADYKDIQKREAQFAELFLKGFSSALDAHTTVFTPKEAEALRINLDKDAQGLGVVVRSENEGFFVDSIVKGSPADHSKRIKPSDQLIAINGQPTRKLSYEKVQKMLDCSPNLQVALTLKRDNSELNVSLKSARYEITEGRVQMKTYPFKDGVLAYIFLPSFYGGDGQVSCAEDIKRGLTSILSKQKVYGVLLDLRANRGGYLQDAVEVVGLFITTGVVVQAKYFDGHVRVFRDLDPEKIYSGPMVVLTSKMTASAAEITAEALKEYGVALIVGDETTYGKGSVQYETASRDGKEGADGEPSFKVTVGKYYSPAGKSTQLDGVQADIVVPGAYTYQQIGERYLKSALPNDTIPSEFVTAASPREEILALQKSSLQRLSKNAQYSALIKSEKSTTPNIQAQVAINTLQLEEALEILKEYASANSANKT